MEQTRPRGWTSGQAIIMVTVGAVFLFSILGLVIDVGYGYYIKQVAQAAADSAVLAGVAAAQSNGASCGTTVLCQTGTVCAASPTSPPVTDFDVACLYAKQNGFPSSGNQTVTVSAGTGSPSGVSVSATYWMTVTATQSSPLTFLRMLGFTTDNITAQATGAVTSSTGGGCVYVLSPLSSAAYNQVGNTTFQSNCGIYDNSSAGDALTVKGGAVINTTVVNVVGGTKINNNVTITPNPTTGASSTSDPFATLPAPSYSGCNYTNTQYGSGANVTLNPGVYCGGIKVSGNAIINFNAGTYVLNGGGMQVTSSYATLNGNGVFFYNTSNGYTFGPITIAGNATLNLSAPTSGTYEGILFYQDRSVTSSAASAIGGGSTEVLSGTIYLPTSTLEFAGGSSANSLTMALVVYNLDIVGNTYLQKDTTGTVTGLSPSTISLVQ